MTQSWWKRLFQSTSRPAPHGRRSPSARPLAVEQLEDRTVPTILFTPRVPQTAINAHGPTLSDPPVYLIFWGAGWNTSTDPSKTDITSAATDLLAGPYLSLLNQYGSGLGSAHFAKAITDSTTPFRTDNKFTDGDIRTVIENAIDGNRLPDSDDTTNQPIYVVLTLPGFQFTLNNGMDSAAGGRHDSYTRGFIDVDRINYAWVSSSTSGALSRKDTFTSEFMHEIAEAITDTDPFGNPAVTLTPGSVGLDSGKEIADGEAQDYTARIGGRMVQSYWSQLDHGYVIPNGTANTVLVNGSTGELTVPAGFSVNRNDTITLNTGTPGVPGLNEIDELINFNGETSVIPLKNGVSGLTGIAPITVKILGANSNTVNVESADPSAPVSIQLGRGNDTVNISPSAKNLNAIQATKDTDHIVTVHGGTGIAHLNVNDQNNTANTTYTLATATSGPVAVALVGRLGSGTVQYDGVRFVTVNGGSGLHAFIINGTEPNSATTVNTNSSLLGVDTVTVSATSANSTLAIVNNGGHGNDTLLVGKDVGGGGRSLQSVLGGVSLSNTPDRTHLFVDDSADTSGQTATLAAGTIAFLAHGQIDYVTNDVNGVDVRGGSGADTFTVVGTPDNNSASALTTLDTGTGADKVFVKATSLKGPLTVAGRGTGVAGVFDTVTIGNAGSLKGIKGLVTVKNTPNFTNLVIDGSADAASPTAPLNATLAIVPIFGSTLKVGKITGLAPAEIDYAEGDLASLEVKAGQGAGTIMVTDTMGTPGSTFLRPTTIDLGAGTWTVSALATSGPLTVNAGPGLDTLHVGSTIDSLDTIQGAVTLNGQGLFTTPIDTLPTSVLFLEDSGSSTPLGAYLTTGATSPTGVTGATETRPGAAPMTVFNGTLNIHFPPGPTATAAAGPTSGGPVFNVKGIGGGASVILIGDNGHATVNVGNDSGTLDDIRGSLTVTGHGGSAAINVHDEGAGAAQVYTLGAGTLARSGAGLIGSDLAGSLVLSGGRGGNTFDVEALAAGHPTTINAGPGGDLVRMRGGPISSALTLNGTGNTRLGYAAYTSDVYANLAAGVATDVAAFRGIHSLTGGKGNNILVGGAGDDELIAGPGRSLLIGGGGRDHLVGGGDEDILIGGRTAYDGNRAALTAVLAEWGRADLGYEGRVNHLLHGGGLSPVLDASTVFDDGAADLLEGGKGRDLFFAGINDPLPDLKDKKEVVVEVG